MSEIYDKAQRYDDLIAAVRELNDAIVAMEASDGESEQAQSDFEQAMHEVLLFLVEDDHARAMERAGVTCYELHTATVTRSA